MHATSDTVAPPASQPIATTPVLIAGAGLTGLSAALFLAARGVRVMVVERHPGILQHPRARGFNQRTMELFRQVGLEAEIMAAADAGVDGQWHGVLAETLAAEHAPVADEADPVDYATLTPSALAMIGQDRLETILRDRARALGATIAYQTELVRFTQDELGVTAQVRQRVTGQERVIRAGYLIAADGWRSAIRQRLGIPVDGPGVFFEVLTVLARADLRPALRGRPVNIAYLQQPMPGTVLLANDQSGTSWGLGVGYDAERDGPVESFTDEHCLNLLRAAAGLPALAATFEPQIPGTAAKALTFPIGAQIARHFQAGRVFLAGDAARLVPPTGGLGANSGIQDAHNLAWKLALVGHGQAAPSLLATYEAERRPVAALTMARTLAEWEHRMERAGEAALDFATLLFGYRYDSAAVIGGDPAPVPAGELRAQPGTRLPHAWLRAGERRLSTVDLCGDGFVLLTGAGDEAWRQATPLVAASLGIDLRQVSVYAGAEVTPEDGAWDARVGLRSGEALLVRPDGVVAWRGDVGAGAGPAALGDVLGHLIGRAAPAAALAA